MIGSTYDDPWSKVPLPTLPNAPPPRQGVLGGLFDFLTQTPPRMPTMEDRTPRDRPVLKGPIDQIVHDTATLPERAINAARQLHETGTYDPGPAVETAFNTVGSGMIFAKPGAAGSAGGRLIQPTRRIANEGEPGVKATASPMASTFRNYTSPGWGGGAKFMEATPNPQVQTVTDPVRMFYPGIYMHPKELAAQAGARVAPEHSALKELFGVTRDDLWQIGQQGRRKGNIEPSYNMPDKVGGSYVSDAIMNPRNEQRLIDALAEARKQPELFKGMASWYVMDPAFQQMAKLVGFEQAVKDYNRFNTVTSMFSPASGVKGEINRGTAANMMIARGEWPKFVEYGGLPPVLPKGAKEGARSRQTVGDAFPPELTDVAGHLAHTTAHATPVSNYLRTGVVDMSQPKVPLYMQASGVPETGFQTRLPVGDAHFGGAIGAADVRTTKAPGVSLKGPEYHETGPWFRDKVAEPSGLQAVPGQAVTWGLFSPQTGVRTAIGAPKLELLAQSIWERAQKLGVDPKKFRDDVLTGKAHASWLLPALALPFAGQQKMGDVAQQEVY